MVRHMHRGVTPVQTALVLALWAGCGSSTSLPPGPRDGATATADAASVEGIDGAAGPDLGAVSDAGSGSTEPGSDAAAVALDGGTGLDVPPPTDLALALDRPAPIDAALPSDGPRAVDVKLPGDPFQFSFEALPDAPLPPSPGPDVTVLVPGPARLVGTHLSACSNAVPASGNGDRWCAFTLPNRQIGFTDLWVINLTKALAGPIPKCDGSDPNCKLLLPPGSTTALGTQLWTDQPLQGPVYPTTHRFDGDTLIFHAQASDAVDQYSGPIFAWRPGMDAPRQISLTKTAYSCSGHSTADSYVCIENLSTSEPLVFDLTGGKLSTTPKMIKHIVPFRAGTQTSQWRAALNRAGDTLLFSTGGLTVSDRETIYVSRFDAPDVVTTLRVGASRWTLSADGTKVYFLANYNYDPTAPAGTLMMADFPGGANEKTLAPAVAALQVLADGEVDKGLGFFDNILVGKATFKIMRDRNVPAAVTTVVTNIGGTIALTRDLKYLYYYKDFNQDNGATTDGYIAKTDGTMTSCTLTATLDSDQFGSPFSEDGSRVFWTDNIDQIDGVGEGWTASTEGCTLRRKYSDKMDFWFVRHNDGLVFSDEGTADHSALKVAPYATLATPTVIQRQVYRIYALIPDARAVLFTIINSPADQDGIYWYSKLPF
jgi:hypothetical protein